MLGKHIYWMLGMSKKETSKHFDGIPRGSKNTLTETHLQLLRNWSPQNHGASRRDASEDSKQEIGWLEVSPFVYIRTGYPQIPPLRWVSTCQRTGLTGLGTAARGVTIPIWSTGTYWWQHGGHTHKVWCRVITVWYLDSYLGCLEAVAKWLTSW